jgi:hypothetical protein
VRHVQAVVLAIAASGVLAASPVGRLTGATSDGALPGGTVAAQEAAPLLGDVADEDESPRFVAPSPPIVFETTSNAFEVIRGDRTRAEAVAVLGRPCPAHDRSAIHGLDADGEGLVGGSDGEPADLLAEVHPWPPDDEDGAPTGPCAVVLRTRVANHEPATGWLTVGDGEVAALEPDQVVAYRVSRSTSTSTFLVLAGIAAVTGAAATARFRWSEMVKRVRTSSSRPQKARLKAPASHPLHGSWVSSLTAVGAGASAVLAATGALAELAPQYATASVVVGNILVLTLLAIAAALVATGKDGADLVRVGYAEAAVFVAASAIAGQLLLVALVLVHASARFVVRWWVISALTFVLLAAIVWSVRYAARPAPD